MALRLLLALALSAGLASPSAAQTPASPDAVAALLVRVRDLARKGDSAAPPALSATGPGPAEFVQAMTPAPTELVIKERDRGALPGGGQRLLLEIFAARDAEAR